MSDETQETPVEDPEQPDEDSGNPEADGTEPDEEEAVEPVSQSVSVDSNGVVTKADGSVVYTRTHQYPVSNAEQERYELTHEGDQERYHLKPGDQNYSPYADPAVSNSYLARQVEAEIASYADRVQTDPNAVVSPIWVEQRKTFEGSLAEAIRDDQGNSSILL